MKSVLLATLGTGALAALQTVYWPDTESIVLSLANGDLVSLSGDSIAAQKPSDLSLDQLPKPPNSTNAVLAATSEALLAFHGDLCDSMQVARYDSSSRKWAPLDTADSPWLRNMTAWGLPQDSDIVYLYGGGECDGSVSNRLVEFNTTAGSFTEKKQSISPAEIEGATAAVISNSSALLVGGKSSEAWIGMTQLAQWQGSSWTFRGIANSSGIDSRTNALAVSVFPGKPFQQSASSVVVVGGTVAGRSSEPHAVRLNLDDGGNGWTWCNDTKLDLGEDILGVFGAYNTVAVVRSSSSKRSLIKRSGYSIDLYDVTSGDQIDAFPNDQPESDEGGSSNSNAVVETLTQSGSVMVQTVTREHSATKTVEHTSASASATSTASSASSPSASPSSKPHGMSKSGVAALSTVLPVTAVAVVGAVVMAYRSRRKRKEEEEDVATLENPFASDAASIDSWNEKRQWLKLHSSTSNDTSDTVRGQKPFPGPPMQPSTSAARRRVSSQPTHRIKRLFSNYDSSGDEPEAEEETVSDQEDFFRNRDVQILVSSQRRSRLIVTNPDTNSDEEPDYNSK